MFRILKNDASHWNEFHSHIRENIDENCLFFNFIDVWINLESRLDSIEKIIAAIIENRHLSDKIIITDDREYRENSIYILVKQLVERNIFDKKNIHVILTSYPHEQYISIIKNYCNLYHFNFWFLRDLELNINSPIYDKKHNFICFNHRTSISRLLIVDKLCSLGYKDSISWSGKKYREFGSTKSDNEVEKIIEFVKQICIEKYKINFTYNKNWMLESWIIDNDIHFHQNNHLISSPVYSAAINVVTESLVDTSIESFDGTFPELNKNNSSILVSEKTIKPILAEQIFLIQGNINTLQYLHIMGFQTFGDFIDESYDKEPDWIKRTEMIVKEVDKLMKMQEKEWLEFYENIIPILKHNRQNLLNLEDSRKYILKL